MAVPKRVQPGMLRGQLSFHEVQLLRHDCAPLGQTSGSPLIDLETQVKVWQYTGSDFRILRLDSAPISGSALSLTLPAQSITLLVVPQGPPAPPRHRATRH